MNEFEIIENLIPKNQQSPLHFGVGDDCSVVEFDSEHYQIQCTDCLIENVHFRRHTYSIEDIAYKSLAVNLSDIAAMGGTPQFVHLSLGLPPGFSESEVKRFFSQFVQCCNQWSLQIAGGDLAKSPQELFINVHITGRVRKDQLMLRKNLSQTSLLCVSGNLGDSGGGLFCLEKDIPKFESLKNQHRRPPIELKKAQWLAASGKVLGMMDLSDGLFSDLQRLPAAHFKIDLDKIPHSKDLQSLAQQNGKDIFDWSIAGGEDYRLLFNCEKQNLAGLQESFNKEFGESFFCIGEVESGGREIHFSQGGQKISPHWKGYSHFN